MAGFSQLGALPDTFVDHIRKILMSNFDNYTYQPYGVYTERYLDWNDPANVGKIDPLKDEMIGFARAGL